MPYMGTEVPSLPIDIIGTLYLNGKYPRYQQREVLTFLAKEMSCHRNHFINLHVRGLIPRFRRH